MGPYVTRTSPYDGRLSTGQIGRKPMSESCSALSHTLYGISTGQKYFTDHAGPYSMPHAYPCVLRALVLTGPINCMRAECDMGISHKPFKRQWNGINWLTMDSPKPRPSVTILFLNGLMGSLTEMGAQQENLEFCSHKTCTYKYLH